MTDQDSEVEGVLLAESDHQGLVGGVANLVFLEHLLNVAYE